MNEDVIGSFQDEWVHRITLARINFLRKVDKAYEEYSAEIDTANKMIEKWVPLASIGKGA